MKKQLKYALIKNKQSDLARSKRDQVEKNITEYIRVGHIKLKNKNTTI